MNDFENETVLYQERPAMFRNRPVGFILSIVLIAAFGLGLVILLVWWLKCYGIQLTVTDKQTQLRKGILSKHTNEVWHSTVRNIQVSQSFFQRIFGVGSIGISSAGQSGIEIDVQGMRDPEKVRSLIEQYRS